jgi:hypothetical protein
VGEKSNQYLRHPGQDRQRLLLKLLQLILLDQLLKREVVRSASELDEFNRILANQKLVDLARKVDLVNPKQKEAPTATGSNVFLA